MLTEEGVKELALDAETRFLEYIRKGRAVPEALVIDRADGVRAEIEVETLYKILEIPAPDWQKIVDTGSFHTL